jgi:hypothetical protein
MIFISTGPPNLKSKTVHPQISQKNKSDEKGDDPRDFLRDPQSSKNPSRRLVFVLDDLTAFICVHLRPITFFYCLGNYKNPFSLKGRGFAQLSVENHFWLNIRRVINRQRLSGLKP